MHVTLCGSCLLQGFCRKLRSRQVTEREIDSRQFIIDLKRYARRLPVSFDGWASYLVGVYRDYPGQIVDAAGEEVYLDTEVFALPSVRYWFREFIGKDPMPVTASHIRREAIERVIVMASILRADKPARASLWGKVIANDYDLTRVPANTNLRPYCPHAELFVF